ncbi:AAA ATPase cdc48 [Steccherinum ochraceum]|uniref:AAA ATPase cdc48 n=1 Tax=Steccherinum ochraceum TaxID=92696 RepID=A0A4R0R426_9APHY|nr:AAA ATPase cdc48 [Steccherinum ochraceum]
MDDLLRYFEDTSAAKIRAQKAGSVVSNAEPASKTSDTLQSCLVVEIQQSDDWDQPAVAFMSRATMNALELSSSNVALVKHAHHNLPRQITVYCLQDSDQLPVEEGKVRLHRHTAYKLDRKTGDTVTVQALLDIQHCNRLLVGRMPYAYTLDHPVDVNDLVETGFKPHFAKTHQVPIRKGDIFSFWWKKQDWQVMFQVMDTDPPGYCVVGSDTLIDVAEGDPDGPPPAIPIATHEVEEIIKSHMSVTARLRQELANAVEQTTDITQALDTTSKELAEVKAENTRLKNKLESAYAQRDALQGSMADSKS